MIMFTVLFTAACVLTSVICNRFTRYDIDKMSASASGIVGGVFGLLISITIAVVTK